MIAVTSSELSTFRAYQHSAIAVHAPIRQTIAKPCCLDCTRNGDARSHEMAEGNAVPSISDASMPNAGRIYDYVLGGNHNFEVDRKAGEQVLAVMPDFRLFGRLIRWFRSRRMATPCSWTLPPVCRPWIISTWWRHREARSSIPTSTP